MLREHRYFVDTLTGRHNGVMCIGMISDLLRRLDEHRRSAVHGFTSRYDVTRLVYFEQTPDVFAALSREREIEKWRREKKVALVVAANPQWRDLATELLLHSLGADKISRGAREDRCRRSRCVWDCHLERSERSGSTQVI